ncbi:MAG: hypothetical protein J6M39_05710 [Lachnospiraceae bacterium]|nr:hypothetical protein [Lachnospiraceae bacterium]
MRDNRLKYAILVLLIIVFVLAGVIYMLKSGQPTTIFHTPWFDVVK